jgi:hypothetical protein
MADIQTLITAIFQPLQIVLYIFFILFYGSIIIKGFRGYLPWHMKLLARIGFGFISLICTIALSPILPMSVAGIYKIIQLDFLVASIISAAVLTLSLFLASHKIYNTRGMEKSIEKLKSRLEKAKSIEKEMAGKNLVQKLMQPLRLVGIIALAAFIIFSLANFRGFPDMSENVMSGVYETAMDIQGSNQTIPQGCVSPLELAQNFGDSMIKGELPTLVDSGTETLIESNSGESVVQMYRLEYKQKVFAFAVTAKQSLCSATGSEFCGCISLGSVS